LLTFFNVNVNVNFIFDNRHFLKRMVGGKYLQILGAAFDNYKRVCATLKENKVSLECDNLRMRVEQLEAEILSQQLQHNGEKLNILLKNMDMLDSSLMRKCWNGWVGFLDEKKQEVLKCTRFFTKLLRGLETRTFVTWKLFTKDSKRSKLLVYNIMSKIVNQQLSAGWVTWCEVVREGKKHDTILLRFGAKLRKGAFMRCFNNWHGNVKQIVRERNLIQRFSMRMKNKVLYNCFDKLAKSAQHERGLKILCYKALCRVGNSQQYSAFNNWAVFARESKYREDNVGKVLTKEEQEREWREVSERNGARKSSTKKQRDGQPL